MITDINTILHMDEESLDDVLIWVDHRSEEEEIVEAIAEYTNEPLRPIWKGESLWVAYREKEYKLPLTITCHDRYVAISSLAQLFKDQFTFWVLKDSFDGDTHALLITDKHAVGNLPPELATKMNEQFVQLELGVDYFGGINVPYLGHEDNNPDFEEEARAQAEEHEAFAEQLKNSDEFQGIMSDLRKELGTDAKPSPSRLAYAIAFGFFLLNILLQIAMITTPEGKSTAYFVGQVIGAVFIGAAAPGILFALTQIFKKLRQSPTWLYLFMIICMYTAGLKLIRWLGL